MLMALAMISDSEIRVAGPSTYRIAVYQYDPFPGKDLLNGQFSREKTPIVREVTGGEEINIDVGNPKGEPAKQ